MTDFSEITDGFFPGDKALSVEPYGNGHINDTYRLMLTSGSEKLLQRVNTKIFTEPVKLMENILELTAFLCSKLSTRGGDTARGALRLNPAGDKHYYVTKEGFWRCYDFIGDSMSIEVADDPELLYQAGRAFGGFQRDLADYPAERLHETIKDFHNTKKRCAALFEAEASDPLGRVSDVRRELEFAKKIEPESGLIHELLSSGKLPLRVTHNDTKLNNVLFDTKTKKPLCIVDLDTVMPGSLLYDFGDAIRSGANSSDEDERDLSKTQLNLDHYNRFTEGFLEGLEGSLIPAELDMLPFAAKLMCYECGVRFLTDYLFGDVYFKTHRPGQNLDRFRTQFKLVSDIEKIFAEKAVKRK